MRKGVNLLSQRQDDDSAWMLTRTSSDSRTAKHNPVNLTFSFSLSPLGKIILHIAKGRLIRQRSDGSRPISLPCPKDDLCILMGKTLVISGEIQVNIRLFISLEPKEGLKRNVKSILHKRLAAHRTRLVRHIPSAPPCICPHLLRLKITVMAMFTIIMGT